jgi:hypothetical protein
MEGMFERETMTVDIVPGVDLVMIQLLCIAMHQKIQRDRRRRSS